ncbi:MAG: histidine kinase [Thermomicrobia bacterium]|nr:histidine kinase [Thermomicrobia bacterium]
MKVSWLALQRPTRADLRPDPRDLLLALALSGAAMILAVVVAVSRQTPHAVLPSLLASFIPLLLAWRRRWPIPVFCLVALGGVIRGDVSGILIVAILIATYSLGAHGERTPSLVALLIMVPLVAVAQSRTLYGILALIPLYPFFGGIWFAGQTIQSRERRAIALAGEITRLERGHAEETRAALAVERRRIARELHDVVTHNVSVMVVQAGAARHVLSIAPEQAREALLAVEATGREALTELRHLLGLLSHDDGEDAALAPQPGIEQLPALVQRTRDAGLLVALRITGEAQTLPQGINLAVYRIVQEALTNALKHSGMACTEILLAYQPDGLAVVVADEGIGDAAATGAPGRGLVGMRERVALYGGTLDTGPRPEGGYTVRAWFPMEREG